MRIQYLFAGTPWAPIRRPRRKLAHVTEAGCQLVRFECARCGWHSGWQEVTATKRGVLCPMCNATSEPAASV